MRDAIDILKDVRSEIEQRLLQCSDLYRAKVCLDQAEKDESLTWDVVLTKGIMDVFTEEDAYECFKAIRWSETNGNPVCPHCNSDVAYAYTSRRIFKCISCERVYSVTTDTLFKSRKLSYRTLLSAIIAFTSPQFNISVLQWSKNLGITYKTAHVLAHKLREAMGADAPRLRGKRYSRMEEWQWRKQMLNAKPGERAAELAVTAITHPVSEHWVGYFQPKRKP